MANERTSECRSERTNERMSERMNERARANERTGKVSTCCTQWGVEKISPFSSLCAYKTPSFCIPCHVILFVDSFQAERKILSVSKIAIFIFKRRIFDGTETQKDSIVYMLCFCSQMWTRAVYYYYYLLLLLLLLTITCDKVDYGFWHDSQSCTYIIFI